jgi:lipopolysaccharide export system protein LptC
MTGYDNWHSTIVAWLKIALPLLALAILSTLFLVSRTIDPSDAIPYAQVDIEDRIREPRLTAPRWAGVTDDGSAMTVAADEARPGQAGNAPTAAELRITLESPDGGRADLLAARGNLDTAANVVTVSGGVVITTGTGYRIETEEMSAELDQTALTSPGAVTAIGPPGQISAGGMAITQDPSDPKAYLLVFNKGVKLLYQPQSVR